MGFFMELITTVWEANNMPARLGKRVKTWLASWSARESRDLHTDHGDGAVNVGTKLERERERMVLDARRLLSAGDLLRGRCGSGGKVVGCSGNDGVRNRVSFGIPWFGGEHGYAVMYELPTDGQLLPASERRFRTSSFAIAYRRAEAITFWKVERYVEGAMDLNLETSFRFCRRRFGRRSCGARAHGRL